MNYQLEEAKKDIGDIQKGISDLQKSDTEITNSLAGINSTLAGYDTRFSLMENRIDIIDSSLLNKPLSLSLLSTAASKMIIENYSQETVFVENPVFLSAPTWEGTEIIAIDRNNETQYTANELINQKVFFIYEENGQKVLFYGQYNERMQWDGNCLINVYINDKLEIITDAIYHDGIIQSYKQIIPSKKNEKEIWIVSDRVSDGAINSGVTWTYRRESDHIASFDMSNASSEDMLSYEKFKADINTSLLSEYHGNTSEGLYNDTTGESYYISYADDGTVKTLYEGNFVDGKFDDSTGNAWYITKNDGTPYMYYKGIFKNNTAADKSGKDFQHDISKEFILDIVKDKEYAVDLKWAVE